MTRRGLSLAWGSAFKRLVFYAIEHMYEFMYSLKPIDDRPIYEKRDFDYFEISYIFFPSLHFLFAQKTKQKRALHLRYFCCAKPAQKLRRKWRSPSPGVRSFLHLYWQMKTSRTNILIISTYNITLSFSHLPGMPSTCLPVGRDAVIQGCRISAALPSTLRHYLD